MRELRRRAPEAVDLILDRHHRARDAEDGPLALTTLRDGAGRLLLVSEAEAPLVTVAPR